MEWIIVVTLILIGLTWLYGKEMAKSSAYREKFMDYVDVAPKGGRLSPDGVAPEMAGFEQPLPLADMLQPSKGLGTFTAGSCHALEVSRDRQMELGGQYIQRTNNYQRDYPDNCSAPLTEFVGSVYAPKNGLGIVVPCDGQC
jgi:hypothetical protein